MVLGQEGVANHGDQKERELSQEWRSSSVPATRSLGLSPGQLTLVRPFSVPPS
jgi:hypothetical protein